MEKAERIERVTPEFQAQAISLVNTLETWMQVEKPFPNGRHLAEYLKEQGFENSGQFHHLWNEAPSREKRKLLFACYNFIHDDLVGRGVVTEEDRMRTPSIPELVEAIKSSGYLFEEWIELGQLASYVSQKRAKALPLEDVSHSQILSESAAIVGGELKNGYYRRPRLEVFAERISADPLVQAIDNLIANGYDAIDQENKMGMFASGVKVLTNLIQPVSEGEIRVVSKTEGKEAYVLRARKSLGGRTYINVLPFSDYPLKDIGEIRGESGSSVYLTGLNLSREELQRVTKEIAFRSGVLGKGVELIIHGYEQNDQQEKLERNFWGRQNKPQSTLGRIDVFLERDKLQVEDTGCGMTKEQLYKLFVPRQGTKMPVLLDREEARLALEQKGYVETVENASSSPRVILKRRTEVLAKIDLDKDQLGLFPGDVQLEFDATLRPAGEGRGQSGIFIDENFPLAVESFTDKILAEKYPPEEKARVINSLYAALKELKSEKQGSPLATEVSRTLAFAQKALMDKSQNLVKTLSREYLLIPNDSYYKKLKAPAGKRFFPLAKDILDYWNCFYMGAIGQSLFSDKGLDLRNGYHVFVADLDYGKSLIRSMTVSSSKGEFYQKLRREKEDMFPVIVDPELCLVIVDSDYWDRYYQLAQQEAEGRLSKEDRCRVGLVRRALQGLMNQRVETTYEMPGVHETEQNIRLKPLEEFFTTPQVVNSGKERQTQQRPLYLEDIWGKIDLPSSLTRYEESILQDAFVRFETLKEDGLELLKDFLFFSHNGQQTLLIQDYSGVFYYSIDDQGRLVKTDRFIPIEKGDREPNLVLREEDGQKALLLFDRVKKKLAIYPLDESAFPEGNEVQSYQIVGDDLGYSLAKRQYALMFHQGHPVFIFKKDKLGITSSQKEGIRFYRIDDRENELVFKEEIEFRSGLFIPIIESVFIDGSDRLLIGFIDEASREAFLGHYRLDEQGQLEEVSLDRLEVSPKDGHVVEIKVVEIGGRNVVLLSTYKGKVVIASIEAEGMICQQSLFSLAEDFHDPLKIADVSGNRLLCINERGVLGIIEIDPSTFEAKRKAFCQVDTPENHYSNLEVAKFVRRDGRENIMYLTSHQGYGFLDILDEENRLSLHRVVPPRYGEKMALIQRYLDTYRQSAFQVYPEEARSELTRVLFYLSRKSGEYQRLVEGASALVDNEAVAHFFTPEVRRFLNSLPSDTRSFFLKHALDRFNHLILVGSPPRRISHCEFSLVCLSNRAEINLAYFKLLDELEVEKAIPLLEDRMKLCQVIDSLRDWREGEPSLSYIERLSCKLKKLAEHGLLLEVVDSLFASLPEPKFGFSSKSLKDCLTAENRPYYFYLTSEAELIRHKKEPLKLEFNRATSVSGLAYLGKTLGAKTIAEMEEVVKEEFGMRLEEYLAIVPDLSEFDSDWQIAVHFSGVAGVEQREIIQNAEDAIRRRKLLYQDIEEGSIVYDFYTQSFRGEKYLVQDVLDNGCGMSDEARLCFAVSRLSDKGEFGKKQSGEFGAGFSPNYRHNDLVVVDTVRIIDQERMLKGAARDIYQVVRSSSGYAQRLILVGSFENNKIDQRSDLGIRFRILRKAEGKIPELEAVLAANHALKFGFLTALASREKHFDTAEVQVPIRIYQVGQGEKGKRWKRKEVEIAYQPFATVQLDDKYAATLYEGDGSIPSQVSFDGRYLKEITPDLLELTHPTLRKVFKRYHLVINLHGFTPILDRGNVLEKEEERVATANLLTRYSSYKLLTDPQYDLEGMMPVDFRETPRYLSIFESIDPEIISLVCRLNNRQVMTKEDSSFIAGLSSDDLNFVLACLEHDDGLEPKSMLMERMAAFVKAYERLLSRSGGEGYRERYRRDLENCFQIIKSVASEKTLSYLEGEQFNSWYQRVLSRLLSDESLDSLDLQDVTELYAASTEYCFIQSLYAQAGLESPRIIRGMLKAGYAYFDTLSWFSEEVITDHDWDTVIHEPGHGIERRLRELGIGSRYSHQPGVSFGLAYKVAAWKFLDTLLGE